MFIKFPLLVTVVFLISCSTNTNIKTKNGFDTACAIFQKASLMKLSPQELGNYIADALDKMPPQRASEDVKQVYHALFNVSPKERYTLFKESAEITLKRSWDCHIMKKMYK